jgi:hypothetical protein
VTVSTITQARDEILGVFKTAWDAGGGGAPVLYWDTSQEKPDSGAWARVTVRHAEGDQATLSGETGNRRFRHFGVVIVEVYTPTGDGLAASDSLALVAKGAFEGVTTSPGRVIFRRARINEIGQDGQWFHTNVLADFEYDEVK